MTCSQASWRKRFPCMASAENSLHTSQKRLPGGGGGGSWNGRFGHAKTAILAVGQLAKDSMELTPPKIEEKAISVVKQHKHLGVVLSDDLSWSAHITHVLAQGKRKAGFLRYMAKELPADLVSKIYITYVRPTLEYASPVWHGDLSKQQSLALERVQASVARRILKAPSPLETRLKLKLLVHTFRCIHNKASSLLCAQYQVRSPTHSTQRTTRAQTYTSLIIPRVSKSAGAKSPAFFSTLLWNELPSDLRSLSSVHSFRQKLMVYLDSL